MLVLYVKRKDFITVYNTKKQKRQKESLTNNKNKSLQRIKGKTKLQNVQLLIVQNTSILNVFSPMLVNNILSTLTRILCTLGVLCTIVINVELVEILCQFCNVWDARNLFIFAVCKRRKLSNYPKNNLYVIIILKTRKIWKRLLKDLIWPHWKRSLSKNKKPRKRNNHNRVKSKNKNNKLNLQKKNNKLYYIITKQEEIGDLIINRP